MVLGCKQSEANITAKYGNDFLTKFKRNLSTKKSNFSIVSQNKATPIPNNDNYS